MHEAPNQRSIWAAACFIGRTVLFRLNSGIAWAAGAGKAQRLPSGDVLVPGGRPVTLGFGRTDNKPVGGAGDLIGWHSMVITPEMVGCRVAVFTSIECKRPKGGKAGEDQLNWRDQVRAAGGIAVIANSPSVVQDAIANFKPPPASD